MFGTSTKGRERLPSIDSIAASPAMLVFGKTQKIVRQLKDQFAASKPEREYVADRRRSLQQKQGTFESLLATDKDLNRFSTEDESIGQLAITHFRVVGHLTRARRSSRSDWKPAAATRFACTSPKPATPFSATPVTSPKPRSILAGPNKRLALHARLLGFTHPSPAKTCGWKARCRWRWNNFSKRRDDGAKANCGCFGGGYFGPAIPSREESDGDGRGPAKRIFFSMRAISSSVTAR